MSELKEGDKAPAFSAAGSDGKTYALKDLAGQTVVLYFYPRDNTPGCTVEACEFRDHLAAFREAGAVILGVSTDSLKSHAGFIEKQKLNFVLLADTDKAIHQAYGVWARKKFMGREYMGTLRTTFVIGPDGRLKRVFREVKPKGHAGEVLAAV
ncbi:MAG: thioredoxin-dependent thiol peroxidase [Verrucomicrobia bacterium]|nr:thioredoxin-dependent thiol peroxidase [Verrucomicrobiota bacterium]